MNQAPKFTSTALALCVSGALLIVSTATPAQQLASGDAAHKSAKKSAKPSKPVQLTEEHAAIATATDETARVAREHAAAESAAPAPMQSAAAEPAKTESAAPPAGEPFSAEIVAKACNACHGPDGNSALPEMPSLAGQTARYLYLQLKDFKEKRRENPLMSPMAANLDKAQMLALAQYYAEKKLKANDFKADAEKVKLGKAKADEVLCTMCHLGGFAGQNEIPRVAGQRYDYIVKQLKDFKAMKRTNDAGNMTSVSKTLKDEDIEALAHYITSIN